MKYKLLSIILSIFVCSTFSIAQPEKSQNQFIGKEVPDLPLNNLINYSVPKSSLSKFRGKNVILGFWNTHCVPCVAHLPHMKELQEKYSKNLQIIMVTSESKGAIDTFYNRFKNYRDLRLVNNIKGRNLFDYFEIPELYVYVWIDSNGIIKAITSGDDVKDENVNKLIERKVLNLQLPLASKLKEQMHKENKRIIAMMEPFDSTDLKALKKYSMLTGFIPEFRSSYGIGPDRDNLWRARIRNNSVRSLFNIAYGGSKYFITGVSGRKIPHGYPINRIIYDIYDTARYGLKPNVYDTTKLYCYDLIIPADSSDEVLSVMKEDLSRYFPEIKARSEVKKTKCLAVVITDSSKLSSTEGKSSIDRGLFFIKMTNSPISSLVETLQMYNLNNSYFFLDETGFVRSINLDIQANLRDIPSVKKALNTYGLDLIEVEREIDFLVITDKQEIYEKWSRGEDKKMSKAK